MPAPAVDLIQNLSDTTVISASRFNYSAETSGAAHDDTTGWIDLGALDPASPGFSFNKNIVDVMTGSPSTIKQRHVVGYEGSMTGELLEYNDNGLNANVGTEITIQYTNAADGQTTVAAGASTRQLIFLTAVADFAVGDTIRIELGDTAFTWYELKRIKAIDGTALTVTLDGTLSQIPDAGAEALKNEGAQTIFGGNKLRDYQARMTCSFNDGSVSIIHAPKGNFIGEMAPNMGDSQSIAKIPFEFGIIGSSSVVAGFADQQVTLATHYAYNAAS